MRGSDTITVCKSAGAHGVSVRVNDKEIGLVTVSERVRAEAPETLQQLKALGVQKTVMLSDDKEAACQRVAVGLSLDEVHGGLLPEDKVGTVESLIDSWLVLLCRRRHQRRARPHPRHLRYRNGTRI